MKTILYTYVYLYMYVTESEILNYFRIIRESRGSRTQEAAVKDEETCVELLLGLNKLVFGM